MKRLLIATGALLVCLVLPALSSAEEPQFWGGQMGENLPGATMTFKVVDGRVTRLQAEVRVRCHAAGGGPSPNSRLIDSYGPVEIDAGIFSHEKRQVFDGGTSKVKGTFTSSTTATGFYRARYRLKDPRHNYVRACHTGKQDWDATPLSKDEWKELRAYG